MAEERGLKHWTSLGVALLLVVFVAACGSNGTGESTTTSSSGGSGSTTTTAAATAEPKNLVIGQDSDAQTLSPLEVTGVETANVNLHIYDGLVATGPDMSLQPRLATEWEIVDALTWRFKLREGVKFHDGTDFTAEDAKFTIDYILDEENQSGLRSYISPVTEVEIVNDYEILIHTSRPYVTLANQLARAVLVVPSDTYEEVGRDAFSINPVGTGPFRFVEWAKDQYVALEANDDYWAGRPKVDTLTIRTVPDPAARVAALLAGEIQIIADVAPDAVPQVESASGVEVVAGGGLTQNFLALNSFAEPFDDVRVRKALNYAINREEIIGSLLGGRGTVNQGPFAPKTFGYDSDLVGYGYDPEQARSLLAEAGYADGGPVVELWYQSGSGVSGANDQVAAAIAGQLNEVGFEVTLTPLERARYLEVLLTAPQLPHFAIADNRDALGDGDFILGLWFHSARRAHYFNTPALDALIEEQLTLLDRDERLAKLREIGEYIVDEAGIGFLFTVDVLYGVSDRVSGWEARGDRVFTVSHEVDLQP